MMTALMLTATLTLVPANVEPERLPAPISVGQKVYTGASQYRGRYYVPKMDWVRKCIRQRESSNRYHAVSATGKYRGAYQMSPAMGVGAGWMVQRELRQTGVPKSVAVAIGSALRAHPVNKWHTFYQDMAFWVVWNYGKGRAHWAATVPGTACG
jgi:hypothetical protein